MRCLLLTVAFCLSSGLAFAQKPPQAPKPPVAPTLSAEELEALVNRVSSLEARISKLESRVAGVTVVDQVSDVEGVQFTAADGVQYVQQCDGNKCRLVPGSSVSASANGSPATSSPGASVQDYSAGTTPRFPVLWRVFHPFKGKVIAAIRGGGCRGCK